MSPIAALHQPRRTNRLLGLAGVLALAVGLLAPSAVAGATGNRYFTTNDTLTARVVGGPRAGVWRVRVVAPAATERIDFVLRSGDISWHAVVRTSRRTASGWKVVGRTRIAGTHAGLRQAAGHSAGVRWNTADFRLPADGDGRFVVRVELTRNGSYRARGAIKLASEAFSYGPWTRAGSAAVSR